MTAAGDPSCTCGIKAAYEAWTRYTTAATCEDAFRAGWLAARASHSGSFTYAVGSAGVPAKVPPGDK